MSLLLFLNPKTYVAAVVTARKKGKAPTVTASDEKELQLIDFWQQIPEEDIPETVKKQPFYAKVQENKPPPPAPKKRAPALSLGQVASAIVKDPDLKPLQLALADKTVSTGAIGRLTTQLSPEQEAVKKSLLETVEKDRLDKLRKQVIKELEDENKRLRELRLKEEQDEEDWLFLVMAHELME